MHVCNNLLTDLGAGVLMKLVSVVMYLLLLIDCSVYQNVMYDTWPAVSVHRFSGRGRGVVCLGRARPLRS